MDFTLRLRHNNRELTLATYYELVGEPPSAVHTVAASAIFASFFTAFFSGPKQAYHRN